MNRFASLAVVLFISVFSLTSCTTHPVAENTSEIASRNLASAPVRNLLNYQTAFEIDDYKGQSFFSVMSKVIKPALDQYSTKGFRILNGNDVSKSLKNVEREVAKEAVAGAAGQQRLESIADRLSRLPYPSTLYTLPDQIATAGGGRARFDLSTFLSLVSGGGVALKIDDKNMTYHVNYGSGDKDKDEMTGRSFGEAPGHLASDASDKFYLKELENYVRSEPENIEKFYRGILSILINSDSSSYSRISEAGQTVATDFFAVYVAEQDRHLMANLRSHAWDEALLEVTLLGAFHSGQTKLQVMYGSNLTDKTHPQTPGCKPKSTSWKPASMVDYWQFSSSTDPTSCNRSGINVTRAQFRSLGKAITAFMTKKNRDVVKKVETHFQGIRVTGNVFADLSSYLINYRTPAKIPDAEALVNDMTEFLIEAQKNANHISEFISRNWSEDM